MRDGLLFLSSLSLNIRFLKYGNRFGELNAYTAISGHRACSLPSKHTHAHHPSSLFVVFREMSSLTHCIASSLPPLFPSITVNVMSSVLSISPGPTHVSFLKRHTTQDTTLCCDRSLSNKRFVISSPEQEDTLILDSPNLFW